MTYNIGIIVARKGSKRLPNKNIKKLRGKPLVQYSIEHALSSKLIDEVVVTSDDDRVLKIGKKFNCTLIKRPANLSGDNATTISVLLHTLEFLYATRKKRIFSVTLLQPTVPIRDPRKIDEAINILIQSKCDSVISHIPVDYFHPNRMKKIIRGKVKAYCEEEIENVSRDRLPSAYYRDGSIYCTRARIILNQKSIFGKKVKAVINDRNQFVNIDNEDDWWRAEYLLSKI